MFDIFFGWRKASKCKTLIKRLQCRLKLLKNKRCSIVKQLRDDMAQLIKLGYEESAFNRAEQLLKDESIMAAYEILDNYCEFVKLQLSYIRRNKDCPNDINEAVSSLIFASARCADLPELPAIRKLFGERYGQRFATAAVELLHGNLVNREVKEKLSIKSVSDDAKYRLLDEIARDCLKPEILAIEYIPETQQQMNEIAQHHELNRSNSKSEESIMQISNANEIDANSDAICASHASSQQPSPDKIESLVQVKVAEKAPESDSPLELTVDTKGDGEGQRMIGWTCSTTLKHKDEITKTPSSSESFPHFSEESVIYLDDIKELQPSRTTEGDNRDQRLFKFKSPILCTPGPVMDGYEESYTDYDEDQDKKSGSRNFRKTINSYGKRSRRKSFSLENSSMKDSDHEIYYEKPCKRSPSHKHKSQHHNRKLLKKPTSGESEQSNQPCHFNVCSLENPCYRREQFPPMNQKKGLRKSGQFPIFDAEENSDGHFCSCRVFSTQKEKTHVSSNSSFQRVSNFQTRKLTVPPYSRAMTMPQERPRESHGYRILRSNSLTFQNPNHVHPKLPDYDDLAAKFMAMKKENLLYKQ